MKKLIFISLALLTATTANACKCMPQSLQEEILTSDRIFHGRVVSVNNNLFEIEIIQTWKGNFPTQTFRLEQGKSSCERRTFEQNKEYLFFVNNNSVFNCSRTAEYWLTIDPEILDLKIKGIGDQNAIDSPLLTNRELEIVKSLLKNDSINTSDIQNSNVRLAVQDSWVDKWAFFESYRWTNWGFKAVQTGNKPTVILWTGSNWDKSFRKLKKSL